MNCRHCGTPLQNTVLDLGFAPPSNAYLTAEELSRPEVYYPLKVKVCDQCWLVQTEDYATAEDLFRPDYAYFSSTSKSWLKHAARYAETMQALLGLDSSSFVIEIASNDGYLLKNFIAAGVPCLGIEPTDSTATVAEKNGIPVLREFFCEALGKRLSAQGKQADLLVGNNVLAHVPNIDDFVRGLKAALKPGGVITLEFPHLMRLIEDTLFDTVYHEHFSYLSLNLICRIFTTAKLRVWKVETLPTHGGSLRVFGCHEDDKRLTQESVINMLCEEATHGLERIETYLGFQSRANEIKDNLLTFLIEQKRFKKKVVAYGAAAKGNTLLNYAGIKTDLLPIVYDAAKSKQGKFMPGSHIPIVSVKNMIKEKVDFVLILPWNISDEILLQNSIMKKNGVKFLTAVPKLRFL